MYIFPNFRQFVKLSCPIIHPEHAEQIINIFISFRINQNKSVLINPPQQRLAPEPLGSMFTLLTTKTNPDR